jgi:uncharacterized protein (TIGR02444 family)
VSLWEWALEAYSRPGAPEACLALQDEHGQNTSYLLWAVWAEGPDAAALAEGQALARNWDETALKPLREVRRRLKPSFAGVNERAREGLREDVKAAELRAERVLMEALEAICGNQSGGAPALAALQAASRAWGTAASDEALARLAGALS